MSAASFAIANFYTRGYNYYFRPFYESARRHFFPHNPKTFFIFTDNPYIDEPDIIRIPIEDAAPALRHQHLLMILDRLRSFDHFVLFNGNALFLQTIDTTSHEEDRLFLTALFGSTTGLAHPAYLAVCSDPRSVVYIDRDREDISTYWRGGLWGGWPSEVMPMIECLAERSRAELPRDEQQINRYFVTHKERVACLDHRYIWSGMWGNNPHFDIRIVMADKCGAYGSLKGARLTDQKLRDYATRTNVDGPFYVGPGNWQSDVVAIGSSPPELITAQAVQPLVTRLKKSCREILAEVLPPVIFKAVRFLRHGRTTLPN